MQTKQPSKSYANLVEPQQPSLICGYTVLYDYQPTRAGEHPKRFLTGFQGYLQVDGYSGYHQVPDVGRMLNESLMKP